jgi:hypothetical protein
MSDGSTPNREAMASLTLPITGKFRMREICDGFLNKEEDHWAIAGAKNLRKIMLGGGPVVFSF